jgi:hypothetical protein
MMLRRFWFDFLIPLEDAAPLGARLGCGVTAYNIDDALHLLETRVFEPQCVPKIKKIIEDVDVSELDPGHIRPNMGDPTVRGIWFPLGY